MNQPRCIVVCGAGGFLGGHLVADLLRQGRGPIRAVDSKPFAEWLQIFPGVDNVVLDLSDSSACGHALRDARECYDLAADMGGMGFIESNRARCMLNVLISSHLLLAAQEHQLDRFFFASSACVYNIDRQRDPSCAALTEADAYPAMPENGYGWEKLFSERMCLHFHEDFGLPVRIARYHNVYGPCGTFEGGREKAPAAICRKVIDAKFRGLSEIEIWGTGTQTRSFQYVDDCVFGTQLLMRSDYAEPLNIGSSESVTIDQMVDIVEAIAGLKLCRRYLPQAPLGVQGRNSDNTLIRSLFNWEPSTRLANGLERTYAWIHDEMAPRYR